MDAPGSDEGGDSGGPLPRTGVEAALGNAIAALEIVFAAMVEAEAAAAAGAGGSGGDNVVGAGRVPPPAKAPLVGLRCLDLAQVGGG